MSILSRLFGGKGGGDQPAAEPELYKGYAIRPAPAKEGGGYRIGAVIEKDGRSHTLIRADTIGDSDEAASMSVLKAKQVIDQLGDRLFDGH